MSSMESESRNMRTKLTAEIVLKLEKPDLNLYMGMCN